MKREYPSAPIVGVGAVIIDHGQVVLVKRAHPPLQGEWSIPGGAVELGETVIDAIKREIKEETGLSIDPVSLLNLYDRIVHDPHGAVIYHYVLIDYLCRKNAGDLRATSDCDEAQWFTEHELARLSLHSETVEVIRRGFAAAKKLISTLDIQK